MTGNPPIKVAQTVPTPDRVSRFDISVLRLRSIVFGVFVLVLVADFVLAIFDSSQLPALTAVELALAMGTLALAYAAYLQVVSSNASRQEDQRWRAQQQIDRIRDREPHLKFGIREVAKSRQVTATKAGSTGKQPVQPPFIQSELYVENVGPGIAGNVKATLLRLYVDYDPRMEDIPDLPDPFDETLAPDELLKAGNKYEFLKHGLPSSYIAIGPENRMTILNADESADWAISESMELDRMYIVFIEFTDLENTQNKKVAGGATWAVKFPGVNGEPMDYPGEDYTNKSRWYLSPTDQIDKVLAIWDAMEKAAGKYPPAPKEW